MKALMKMVHDLAVEKGWYNPPKTDLECHMLFVSEIAEATEEVRKGTQPIYQNAVYLDPTTNESYKVTPDMRQWRGDLKPEGELVELADAVIRIMDYCQHKGYDLERAILLKHAYNVSRSFRHGGKKF